MVIQSPVGLVIRGRTSPCPEVGPSLVVFFFLFRFFPAAPPLSPTSPSQLPPGLLSPPLCPTSLVCSVAALSEII